ncbi:hypothetical protein PGB90_003043 [Kerria lacca]
MELESFLKSDDTTCIPFEKKTDVINIHFENITFTVPVNKYNFCRKRKKDILKNISGDFQSGKLTAIIGPSGSGKSTLMDIISGFRLRNVSGCIYVNGKEKNIKQLTKKSSYIMQDDVLQPLITVLEAMMFAANIKLQQNLSDNYKRCRVTKILKNFSLDEQTNTLTQNLSGGQRKRLAIALELISNPPILFLDEPTSGLDSKSAKQCLEILRGLSEEGRTIVCSIHQPSTSLLNLFHNAYMLSNGKCIYQGKVDNLIPYLKMNDIECPVYHNPVEYGNGKTKVIALIEICVFASEMEVDQLVQSVDNGKSQKWLENTSRSDSIPNTIENMENEISSDFEEHFQYSTSFTHQFCCLLKRIALVSSRDMFLTHLIFASNIIVGLGLGTFLLNIGNDGSRVMTNFNLLFFCLMFVMYNALTSRIVTFPQEMLLIKRECFNRWYSLNAYYLASTMGNIPVQTIGVISFVLIVYYFSGQPLEWFRFSLAILILVLLALIFQDYGICVGTLFNVQNGLVVGIFSTTPWVMFSGFLLYYRDTPPMFSWLFKTSVLRRAFEALAISVYGFNRKPLECSKIYCHFKYPDFFLKNVDVDCNDFYVDLSIMLFSILLVKLCCYLALKYKISTKR